MAVPTIGLIVVVLTAGVVGTKLGQVELPFPLFTALVLLVFTEILGDWSSDLTYGIVGESCTCSCSRASFNSLESSSPSDIG